MAEKTLYDVGGRASSSLFRHTLIEQPALSWYELTTEEREAVGVLDDLARPSVGIEGAADIETDLALALDQGGEWQGGA